ncbi:MAG: hypothetical protein JWQ89_3943 [Devosia sp.]|nr:DUF1127 domain-containing protein [Devosia sp.]MDB5542216.1 hypothetical protein [Devosia sp.]
MFTDLLLLTTELRSRPRFDLLDDRLLADVGLTREELRKRNSWFRRKSR